MAFCLSEPALPNGPPSLRGSSEPGFLPALGHVPFGPNPALPTRRTSPGTCRSRRFLGSLWGPTVSLSNGRFFRVVAVEYRAEAEDTRGSMENDAYEHAYQSPVRCASQLENSQKACGPRRRGRKIPHTFSLVRFIRQFLAARERCVRAWTGLSFSDLHGVILRGAVPIPLPIIQRAWIR